MLQEDVDEILRVNEIKGYTKMSCKELIYTLAADLPSSLVIYM
jgi:hypothetical protein